MKEGYLQATIFGSIDPIDSTPIESDFNLWFSQANFVSRKFVREIICTKQKVCGSV